jgi:hypothetical protein
MPSTEGRASLFWYIIGAFFLSQCFIIFTFHSDPEASPRVSAQDHRRQSFSVNRERPQHETAFNRTADEARALAYVQSFKTFGRSPLNFFHIPKTAGTAVEQAAAERKIAWGSCRFFHKPKREICKPIYPSGPDWPMHVGWWHLPAWVFPLVGSNPYQSSELFAIVRDPYERMVSEFYYICTLKVKEWRPDQCDNRTRLFDKDYMNQWLAKKLSDRESSPLTASSYLSDNGHFTPQADFLVGPHQVRMVDYVLRLDDPKDPLSDQFQRLTAAFGLSNMRLPQMGAISAGERNTTEHLSVGHLQESTLDSIHRRYPHDFTRLGYEMSVAPR